MMPAEIVQCKLWIYDQVEIVKAEQLNLNLSLSAVYPEVGRMPIKCYELCAI